MIYSKKMMRKLTAVIPPSFRKLWKEWDLRLAVLVSLTLQIILIILGHRRKYDPKHWIIFVAWSVYLAADAVATFALGALSNNLTDMYDEKEPLGANAELTAFWAPFLLLHLGGPDTITAYALEDNELWLRHLLGLVVQTTIAFYVFLMAWTGSRLSFLSILMFFVGLVKYGERTWVLRSASNDKLRESMFTCRRSNSRDNDLFRAENRVKIEGGYIVRPELVPEVQLPIDLSIFLHNDTISYEDKLLTAFGLLETTKGLFLDGILSSRDGDSSKSALRNLSSENAFEVIEMELGLMYDLLYTKSPLLYTVCGLSLRLLTFSVTCSVFGIFTSFNFKDKYSKVDRYITFVLLVVAIILEMWSAILQVSSDRFVIWLIRHKKTSTFQERPSFPLIPKSPRWSHKISQISLISFFKPLPGYKILKPLSIDKLLEEWWYLAYEEASKDLKKVIFQYFKEKAAETTPDKRKLKPWEKDSAPQKSKPSFLFVPIAGREADVKLIYEAPNFEEDVGKSILYWHIVTEVSYYLDQATQNTKQQFDTIDKHFGVDKISLQETVYRAANNLRKDCYRSEYEACTSFIHSYSDFRSSDTLLYDALDGVSRLKRKYEERPIAEKWNKLGCTWLEIVAYTASKCKGSQHGQQLRHGGEFLTHVWLLMAHFGLTDHFQISEPHITRLIFE
ncbi:DUF594 family protein [Melia azedarach]|uniref:DUF594 family protein n=1 Tax=Melia azedarach TaxID=155640 RepID=A0ACC1Y244_MELAZ|nr:DUF594 family protein [Melia azedarach]